jgi:hypothetical protein
MESDAESKEVVLGAAGGLGVAVWIEAAHRRSYFCNVEAISLDQGGKTYRRSRATFRLQYRGSLKVDALNKGHRRIGVLDEGVSVLGRAHRTHVSRFPNSEHTATLYAAALAGRTWRGG